MIECDNHMIGCGTKHESFRGTVSSIPEEYVELASKLSETYEVMKTNSHAESDQQWVKDTSALKRMAKMFHEIKAEVDETHIHTIETDILSVCIDQLPPEWRSYLSSLVQNWLEIVGRGNHYVVNPETYHISLSVPQDIPLNENEGKDVLGHRGLRLCREQVVSVYHAVSQFARESRPFQLIPKGLRAGPDGSLIYVFLFSLELYTMREKIMNFLRGNIPGYKEVRLKPMVSITLFRSRESIEPDEPQAAAINAFFEEHAEKGLEHSPINVNTISLTHETRWMRESHDFYTSFVLGDISPPSGLRYLVEYLEKAHWDDEASIENDLPPRI